MGIRASLRFHRDGPNKRREQREVGRKGREGRRKEGSRVDGKFGRAISRGVDGQKGTQCRGQDRFSSVERITDKEDERDGDRERERERERPRRLRGARRATLLLKRCSPKRFGKQRATGRLRSVINHFLLRKKRARRNVSSCRETRFPIHEPPNFESKKNPFLYYSS